MFFTNLLNENAADPRIVQSLIIPFAMILGDKFRDSSSMMALTERNYAFQTSLLDRADEPFGISVGIWEQGEEDGGARLQAIEERP